MTLTFAFDPVIAQWGPFQLGWHGIFTALAVMVALWLAGRLAMQRGIPSEVVYGIAGWSIAGGLIGARLFHVADHLSYYLENPLLIPAIWEGGIAVYGAFIGGLVGGGIAAWRSHLDPWPLLDIAAPSMLVGQAIGRLGCLCNGDAWGGDATGCPFCLAIRYTNQNDLLPANLRGVPTYAYPLYEIAAEALLLATLWLFRDRLRQRPGLTFLVGIDRLRDHSLWPDLLSPGGSGVVGPTGGPGHCCDHNLDCPRFSDVAHDAADSGCRPG